MKLKPEALLFIGIIVFVAIIGAIAFFLSQPESEEISPQSLVREDSQFKGDQNAPATLVEFADFQCPACGEAFPILEQIKADYPEQLLFVYRHFPLPIHENSRPAALTAEAAGRQNKFWEMHDILFTRQDEWARVANPSASFEKYAQELDLDLEKFKSDRDDKILIEKIDRDISDANEIGVGATPTFFLNGQKIEGVPSFDSLKQNIEQIISDSKE